MSGHSQAHRPAAAAPLRKIVVRGTAEQRAALLAREWLVTNGLGGYAAGTIGGAPSRRYHGVLIAALPPPYGRRLMLTDLHEELYVSGERVGQLTARAADGQRDRARLHEDLILLLRFEVEECLTGSSPDAPAE
jgi:hypothetical protein